MTTNSGHGLGRLFSEDARDLPLRPLLAARAPAEGELVRPPYRYWNDNTWWGDQGRTSQCVAYGWLHWLSDGPLTKPGIVGSLINPDFLLTPVRLYKEAQLIDEWPGTAYDGTSVRAGAKVLHRLGLITEYRFGHTLSELIDALLGVGPVVVGTNWYTGMEEPNSEGRVNLSGSNEGGHCWEANGINLTRRLIRCKNSWGRKWGRSGRFWISFDDMERLIHEQGEVCLAVEAERLPIAA